MRAQNCSHHCSDRATLTFSLWEQDAGLTATDMEPSSMKRDDLRPIGLDLAASILLGRRWPSTHWSLPEGASALFWQRPEDHARFVGFEMDGSRFMIRARIRKPTEKTPGPLVTLTGECGRHFHGKTAFDLHLTRVNARMNRFGAPEYDVDHFSSKGLQVWTEDGACTLPTEDREGVRIWQVEQSEAWLAHLASMQAAGDAELDETPDAP